MNETTIRALRQQAADYMTGCGGGLWLRVRTTGRKTFIVRRKVAGKPKVITLGDWPTLSLKDASRLAVTVKTPSDATIGTLLQRYHDAVIKGHARPAQFATYEKRIRLAMGNARVSEVTAKRLAELVSNHRSTPRAADSLRSHLKAMFALAIELGLRDDNPASVIGARVTGYTYAPRTRVLTHDDIRQLWAWDGRNAALLRFLLLTGLRISEGQHGRQDGDLWRIEKTKNGRPHWVFLTPTAKTQLAESFNVSPTAVQAWVRRRGVTWTPHDLRRTFATLAKDAGVLPHVIEKALNHALEGMLRIYDHAEMTEERIVAAKTVERVVLEITGATGSTGGKKSGAAR
ncbi:MAG: integrase family protein [Gammaproteobacteria bacterium]|nr:integrase family protein [Gammaproteobacteria bacterium]